MLDCTPNGRPADRNWALVWWNLTGLALVLALSLAANGIAGSALDLFAESPRLSMAGRALGFVGGTAAAAGGVLAVRAFPIRSRRWMLAAYGLLLLAVPLLVVRP
ncbi:hypothetical protein [Actinacidiphila soli]|uniref:hypothetical protein n=1 Tax=Actinacidiphila soli TaxID=2487275 RepID=UPI000FCC8541|nr:hypothetical protein [Actinacidiphila soli]